MSNKDPVPKETTEALLRLMAKFCRGLGGIGVAGMTMSIVVPDEEGVGYTMHTSWGLTDEQRRVVLDSAMNDATGGRVSTDCGLHPIN
jgi:hypothetical protein